MTLDPRIPTMPGRSTSGFHQPGRHCLHQARESPVRCSAGRVEGERQLTEKLLVRRTFLNMDDRVEYIDAVSCLQAGGGGGGLESLRRGNVPIE